MKIYDGIFIGIIVFQAIIVLFLCLRIKELLRGECENRKNEEPVKKPEKEALRISRNERSEVGKIEEGK
jgi:hypothetical protein